MLQLNGQIVGVPLMYDGLAMIYNKDVLDSASESPPQTWAELRSLATRLTVKSATGVERAGVALGNASNVEHYSDILALLMLQNGADLSDPDSPETRDALLFYTNFIKTDGVWNDSLPVSSVAFARGDVAIIFAPSWKIHEILATNPDVSIGVAPLPKLSDERLAWATFWAEGINSKGKNQAEAGKLLKHLSSPEVLEKLYSQASENRSFGEIYPRVDMAEGLADDPLVGPYLEDAPFAQGGFLSSFTHDNGLNDNLIQYYTDAINAVLGGQQVEDTLTTVDQGTSQILRQYGAL
jgi:ABC-type glycerol-3-phosphate transport system substrate-binding protein